MSETTLSQELVWRGFVNQTTYKDITELDKQPVKFYFGVDPSADSMTIGNLAAMMMLKHFINHGHKATILVGGATGFIGDPDGKKQERDLKTSEEINKNKQALIEQYGTIFADQDFEVVDNYDWFKGINFLNFLRDIGKHVPMRVMLGRDFVQSRLSEEGSGISYAEFSYSLIQGYDFLHLYREKGITLQLCGADQWGNCIAGVDLIRRVDGGEAHIWSTPLIVNKTTGVKFGKSETGAIWLDGNKTSPYKFYQFWLNMDDDGAIDYLKVFTMLKRAEIEDIEQHFSDDKSNRLAQKTLAYEVTKLIHGTEAANTQKQIAEILFDSHDYESLDSNQYEVLARELPFAELPAKTSLVDALIASNLASSKREAREFIDNGAVSVGNGNRVDSTDVTLSTIASSNQFVLLKRGKKNMAIIKQLDS